MKTTDGKILARKGDDVLTIQKTATVYEAIEKMESHRVGSIIVMDGDNVAGIFTERDYLRRVVLRGRTSKPCAVGDLMTRELARGVGAVVAGLFMIALGLYLGGWWRGLALLERAGTGLWRRVQPLGRRLLPVDSVAKALAAGAIWGWLPCGLVYAALAWSLSAGGPLQGAALMICCPRTTVTG